VVEDQTGDVQLNGLEHWTQKGTGLESKNIDTLGIMLSYHLTDNVSFQMIGGIPPKVRVRGQGQIVAPMSGMVTIGGETLAGPIVGAITNDRSHEPTTGEIQGVKTAYVPVKQDIPVTDLSKARNVSNVRAWTPAIEVQYQFGKSGVDKFRPYIGVGLMFAYFNQIRLNPGINDDLLVAGHRVQNIKNGMAGAALEGVDSGEKLKVKVKTDEAIAPIVTLGFTYDLTESWFAVGAVSYAKLNNLVKVEVLNAKSGQSLIRSSTRIDIDPLMTYVGIGYRF